MSDHKNLFMILNSIEPLKIIFKDNCIPITFSSSDYFAPYLSVTIQSIVDNSNPNCNYDLIIFTKDINDFNKSILKFITDKKNFSIRFVNLSEIFRDLKLYISAHLSIETYFRFVIPLFMKNYRKFIFLDSDIIVQNDIKELFDFDVTNYALGATEECLMSAVVGIQGKTTVDYMYNKLHLKNIDKYFQAGVMLINSDYFNHNNICEKLLDMVLNFDYHTLDQDAMNELLNDKVLWLPNEWNYPPLQKHMKKLKYIENMSDFIRGKYLNVKKPKIIHYADWEKPWFDPSEDYAPIWWNYARKTPYYEEILKRLYLNTFDEKIKDIVQYKQNLIKYWKYNILHHFVFGKTRKRYIVKRQFFKEKIQNIKKYKTFSYCFTNGDILQTFHP